MFYGIEPMRENQLTSFTKVALVVVFIFAVIGATVNILHQRAMHPTAFLIALGGFALFATAKMSSIKRGHLVSLGTKGMSPLMANFYRLGYWLIVVGCLLTFLN
jgi:hypothetical protein